MSDHSGPLPGVLLEGRPAARALLRGSDAHPGLLGEMLFYPWQGGTLVLTRAVGLPGDGFFALHIHAFGSCRTGGDVAYLGAGGHFNPAGRRHPDHAGDLPVLLSGGGRAFSVNYTGRFTPGQVASLERITPRLVWGRGLKAVTIREGPEVRSA